MKTNQKGLIQILLILGIVVVLGVIGWVLTSSPKKTELSNTQVPTQYQTDYTEGSTEVMEITDSEDLGTVASSLESDTDAEFEAELKKLESDLAAF